MDEIHILPTKQTPEFILKPEGVIKIQGRGLYSDKTEVIDRILKWIDDYTDHPAKTTYITIAFEYLNSLSTIMLVSFLRNLSVIVKQSKFLDIKWYYEADDEDILERGKYISSSFKIPIQFILTDKIPDL